MGINEPEDPQRKEGPPFQHMTALKLVIQNYSVSYLYFVYPHDRKIQHCYIFVKLKIQQSLLYFGGIMALGLLHGQNGRFFIDLSVIEPDDIKKRIGNNVKRIRLACGLTQDEVGAKCDPPVDGSHIGAIEAGGGLRVDMLTRICNALQVDPSEIYRPEKPLDIKSVLPEDEEEQLDIFREFKKLGEADRVAEMQKAYLMAVKKKSEAGGKGTPSRVPRRARKRAD